MSQCDKSNTFEKTKTEMRLFKNRNSEGIRKNGKSCTFTKKRKTELRDNSIIGIVKESSRKNRNRTFDHGHVKPNGGCAYNYITACPSCRHLDLHPQWLIL